MLKYDHVIFYPTTPFHLLLSMCIIVHRSEHINNIFGTCNKRLYSMFALFPVLIMLSELHTLHMAI
jgi:hypothetical protein